MRIMSAARLIGLSTSSPVGRVYDFRFKTLASLSASDRFVGRLIVDNCFVFPLTIDQEFAPDLILFLIQDVTVLACPMRGFEH
jgi:hypothetical protein